MKRLSDLYVSLRGKQPDAIEKLAVSSGSNRVYCRLYGGNGTAEKEKETLIGVTGASQEENRAFVYLARHFREKGINVPEVYIFSSDETAYLQQDLGDRSLYGALKRGRETGGRYDESDIKLLENTIRRLPEIQFRGAEGLDFARYCPVPEFDKRSIMFDLNYFKYCFLKTSGIEFNEIRLEEAFLSFAEDLANEGLQGFMYRDFQARNVMLSGDDTPYFIDFQGGRRGPAYYDIASFLWQASALYSASLRERLIDCYYEELQNYRSDIPSKDAFAGRLHVFVLFRILQVLGAYGFRGGFERKSYFIKSIPPAVENLRELLDACRFHCGYLIEVLRELAASDKYKLPLPPAETPERLVVRVFSFSYKRGIPEDETGHGGGYVFDCRGTNNPGRYEKYRQMTGMDGEVIRFLEDDGEITAFLENVYSIADRHTERWIERGFTSLMFSFGCTGGRHRSVYSAEHLAAHLNGKYGIEVRICHKEQGINKVLAARNGNSL